MVNRSQSTGQFTVFFALILCAAAVQAIPVRNRRVVATNTVRRPAAPVPRVALQLTALRMAEGIPMRPMLHAIARDSWPSLVACVQQPRPRGVVSIFFHAHGRSVIVDRVTGAPAGRDAVLRRCMIDATQRAHAPAHDEADVEGSFDLSFDMPAL